MQAESTLVDISDAKTSKELKSEGENEEISIHPEPNDEISIANGKFVLIVLFLFQIH